MTSRLAILTKTLRWRPPHPIIQQHKGLNDTSAFCCMAPQSRSSFRLQALRGTPGLIGYSGRSAANFFSFFSFR